jgi:hypothetical protein
VGAGRGLASPGGGSEHVVAGGGERAQEGGQVGHAPDREVLQPALGHAVGGLAGQGGGRMRGYHDVGYAEVGGGTGDGAEVVGVADAIEHDERRAPSGPAGDDLGRGRGQRGRGDDADDAAVVQGAGDLFQLGGRDAAIDLLGGGEGLAQRAEAAAVGHVEEEPLERAGVAGEARLHGGGAAEYEFVGLGAHAESSPTRVNSSRSW